MTCVDYQGPELASCSRRYLKNFRNRMCGWREELADGGSCVCFCPPPLGEREAATELKEQASEMAPCLALVAVVEAHWTEARERSIVGRAR